MKGPNVQPEIDLAIQDWGHYYELEKNIPYVLPHTKHERRLIVFRKIRSQELGPVTDEDFADDED